MDLAQVQNIQILAGKKFKKMWQKYKMTKDCILEF